MSSFVLWLAVAVVVTIFSYNQQKKKKRSTIQKNEPQKPETEVVAPPVVSQHSDLEYYGEEQDGAEYIDLDNYAEEQDVGVYFDPESEGDYHFQSYSEALQEGISAFVQTTNAASDLQQDDTFETPSVPPIHSRAHSGALPIDLQTAFIYDVILYPRFRVRRPAHYLQRNQR